MAPSFYLSVMLKLQSKTVGSKVTAKMPQPYSGSGIPSNRSTATTRTSTTNQQLLNQKQNQ